MLDRRYQILIEVENFSDIVNLPSEIRRVGTQVFTKDTKTFYYWDNQLQDFSLLLTSLPEKKTYKALIRKSFGQAIREISVYENTLGEVTWEEVSTGVYTLTTPLVGNEEFYVQLTPVETVVKASFSLTTLNITDITDTPIDSFSVYILIEAITPLG